jgi:hypothetical protein
MKPLLYKVNTNFFKTLLNKGFQRVLLIGWALDSTIEVVSAATLGWRLHGELKGIDEDQVNRRKKITLYVIAVSFTQTQV